MIPDRLLYLITQQLSSSLSTEEESELQGLLANADNRATYEWLKKFWHNKEAQQTPDVEKALQSVMRQAMAEEEPPLQTQTIVKKTPRKMGRWIAAGSAVLAMVALLIVAVRNNDDAETKGNLAVQTKETKAGWMDKQNAKGTRSVITLVDGTTVWLNADSRLVYPPSFDGATREVSLVGEAFFDVTKNPQKPFIIHLDKGTVKVLGTSFNIKAYPGDSAVETSVATGRVAFVPKTKGATKVDTTFLTKNKKAVYLIEAETVTTIASNKDDKAWTEGKLIFAAATMNDIALQLERYFGKPVVILDEEIKQYRLTGSFANNTIEEILYYLSKTKPFTYRITETQILISLVR